jgi:hypothetical protein
MMEIASCVIDDCSTLDDNDPLPPRQKKKSQANKALGQRIESAMAVRVSIADF